MKVVAYPDKQPTDAQTALELWWGIKELKRCTVRSDLHRQLPQSASHEDKLVYDILHQSKANVVLLPYDFNDLSPKMANMLHNVVERVTADSAWERNCKRLLSIVKGDVFQIQPVDESQRIVHTAEVHVNAAWGMVQAWLNDELPIAGLAHWMPRDKYLQHRAQKKEART